MKFNVESYLVEEHTQEDEQSHLEEVRDNIDTFKEAGLDSLVEQALEENKDEEDVIPFKYLSKGEERQYTSYYYFRHSVDTFKGPIPVKVASLIALSKSKGYFKKIIIRSDVEVTNALMSSYLLIGEDKDGKVYTLARWASIPLPNEETIRDVALNTAKRKLTEELKKDIERKTQELNDVASLATQYLEGKYVGYFI